MKANNSFLKIINFESVTSTNDYAYELAQEGFDEVVVVRAALQTKGRGRQGNTWVSPAGKGIYASFLLKPPNPLKEIIFLPLIFSLAVADSLKDIVDARIKWPNDVMVGESKICGVLVEARSLEQRADFVIAGVGINVNSKGEELPDCATSLYLETGKTYDIDELFRKFTTKAIALYNEFKKGNIEMLLDNLGAPLKQEALSKSNNIGEVIILR
jgi:BirA family biotin operon repressor/biotin-[acetyl-CoA-carboxylase] ligase